MRAPCGRPETRTGWPPTTPMPTASCNYGTQNFARKKRRPRQEEREYRLAAKADLEAATAALAAERAARQSAEARPTAPLLLPDNDDAVL
eukprot:36684-Chlamydomonas_euryale.AAC.1